MKECVGYEETEALKGLTYDDRAPPGLNDDAAGVWRRPMAETELRRFLSAAKADDWGRSMSSP